MRALAGVDDRGDEDVSADDPLGVLDVLDGGLLLPQDGEDLDQLFQEQVPRREHQEEQQQDLDQPADEGLGRAEGAGEQSRPGGAAGLSPAGRLGGAPGAVGGVLDLVGGLGDLLDGPADLLQLGLGLLEVPRGFGDPFPHGPGQCPHPRRHGADQRQDDDGRADPGRNVEPLEPADDRAEDRVEHERERDRHEKFAAAIGGEDDQHGERRQDDQARGLGPFAPFLLDSVGHLATSDPVAFRPAKWSA